jgi:hypothetical protein
VDIRSKRQFYRLWEDGALGNRTQIFRTLEEAMSSGVQEVGFRAQGAGGGAWEKAKTRDEVPAIFARWKASGRTFIMDDGVPNDRTTMQGEIVRTTASLEGFIAVAATRGLPPMRQSIAAGMHRSYSWLQVRMLMAKFMDDPSRDDIDALLDLYPDHAIEFACFDCKVGNLRRNTIIWEVRLY